MNFRVFLLIAAVGAFGALWSSDGRYQAHQIAIVRAERARSANANAVFIAKIKAEVTRLAGQFASRVADIARTKSPDAAATAPIQVARIVKRTNDAIAPDALFGELIVTWVFSVDPGNGVSVVTRQAALAKAQLEERYCLMRFRTRQAALFASRRATAFLREQIADRQPPGRLARVIIRDIPIKETQAPAGGRQMR